MTRTSTGADLASAALFAEAFDAYGVGLTYWDLATDTLHTNERFAELVGLGPGRVSDGLARWSARIHADDRPAFLEARARLARGEVSHLHVTRRIDGADGLERWVEAWVRPFRDASGSVVALVGAFTDVTGFRTLQTEREEDREWMRRLQHVTAALAIATGVNEVVEIVAGPVAEAVSGKHASVRLLRDDGSLVVAGWTGPTEVELAPASVEDDTPIGLAARSGAPVFDRTIGDIVRGDPARRDQAERAGARMDDLAIAIPLRAPRRVLGVLAITLPADIPLTARRREFLLAAAGQAAQVVERARAFEAEQIAHRDAEEARGRVELLADVTEALAASTGVEEALRDLARLAVPRLADWCFIELVEEDGFRNVAATAVDAEREAWMRSFRDRVQPTGPLYRSALEGGEGLLIPEVSPEQIEAAARDVGHLEELRRIDPLSSIVAPLLLGDRPVGLINLVTGREVSGRRLTEEDLALATEVARRATVALENAMLHTAERAARREAEEIAERVSRLQRVTASLAGAVLSRDVVAALLDEASGAMAARGSALFGVQGDGIRFLGSRGSVDGAWAADARPSFDLLPPLRDVARSSEVVWVASGAEFAERWPSVAPAWRRTGDASCALVPLILEERVIGVLYLGFGVARPTSAAESAFLLTLGRQGAQALERAMLYEEAQSRRALEAATRRQIQHLHAITQAGLAHLRLDDSLHRMLELVIEAVRADVGAVLLDDPEGRGPVLRALVDDVDAQEGATGDGAASGAVAGAVLGRPIDVTATPLEVVFSGSVIESDDVVGAAVPPHPRGRVRSLLALPLRVSGRVLGTLHVGSATATRFGEDERDLVRLATEQVAIAVDRAQLYEREHRIAEVLQRSLLPERLPEIRGVEVAARYLPGSAEAQVGGDWYELLELPDGRIAIAVGDVVGSGVPAAATMGQFRNAMRALALEGLGAARVLERLNELALGLGGDFATALLITLDPGTGMLRYASAGHPPALVLRREGETLLLTDANATPLGVEPGTAYPEAVYPLEPGDTVVLYTDGLVERREEPIDRGFERLRDAAPGSGGIEALVARIVERVSPLDVRDDDIAIIALRYLARPIRFELALPPVAASVAAFRSAFGTWLAESGVGDADALDLTLAVSEACSNAIEHAGGSSGEVELFAEIRGGDAMIAVRDGGRWRPPTLRPERGRGFLILRHVMDSVDVRRRPGGTELRMHRRIDAPA